MTFISDDEAKNYQKDPDKDYVKVFGGVLEFDDVQEYETWLKQN